MSEFLPYFTGDGSVGLYSEEFDDIFHSACGALNEAFEKFINPLEIDYNKDLNILDICYGLGYNSKAFLNTFKEYKKNIIIDCLEINKDLILLSPFIKTNDKKTNKTNLNSIPDKLKNKLSTYVKKSVTKKYKIKDKVNRIIIKNIYEQFGDELFASKILTNHEYKHFFKLRMLKFAKFYQKYRINYLKRQKKNSFLHNIYYKYLSYRYKSLLNSNIKMYFYIEDARKSIQTINRLYDFIFLDAFTTEKCPQLWSIDFIKELYNHTKDNGVLVTYSKSALVRKTLIDAGFYVGKILDKNNNTIGTICSKDKLKIKNELSEYEFGLLNTKAGIPYRDKYLSLSSDEILLNRIEEVNESKLITSSQYAKQFKELKL